MILKFKSWIYKKTGIYLASKEELEYITSDEFWKEFKKIVRNPKNDMTLSSIQGLLIGSWQCKYGFARPFNSNRYLKKLKRKFK